MPGYQFFALFDCPTAKNDHSVAVTVERGMVFEHPSAFLAVGGHKQKHKLPASKLATVDMLSPVIDNTELG